MRLLLDAQREAGLAATGDIAEVVHDALRILLTPPLLHDEGIVRIRSRLSWRRSN